MSGRSPISEQREGESVLGSEVERASVMSIGVMARMFVRTARLPVTPQLAPVSAMTSVVLEHRYIVGSVPSRPTVVAKQ